jgi:microcin C transport system substrate-binding protein
MFSVRSQVLLSLGLLILALALPSGAHAEAQRLHALSRVGAVKFPPDFQHFDWVNPDAPKGGSIRLGDIGGFDNLNPFTYKGLLAPGAGLMYDSLMVGSLDEPATSYGLIAEWVSVPADSSSVTFGLNAAARFQDGSLITPEDVIFSFEEQKKADPVRAITYKDVVKVEKTADREVTFVFARAGNRDLPLLVSQLAVIPRQYWTGRNAAGATRDLSQTTLEPPLGSGPYRIKSVDPNRSIVYERVKDYWAKDLPAMRGQFNFDEIRFDSYRDDVPAFEAFKAGNISIVQENSSKKWATEYIFPAVRDGGVKKLEVPTATVAVTQAFVFNLRRTKFADRAVRQAFDLAFDFESANKNLFYGLYERLDSYFDNSELAARGLPEGRELVLLNEVRDQVPPEVFTTPYRSTVNATPEQVRANLRKAGQLLDEAGWKLVGNVRRNEKTKEPLAVEMLVPDTSLDRVLLPYQQALEKIGVRMTIRVVDAPQYTQRVKTYDFDMIIDNFPQSHAPGNEQREYWGSASADKPASRNIIGIKNPAVDHLIEKIIYAPTREDVIAATRALDRVLLWNRFVVLQWHRPSEWVAYWNTFGRPSKLPSQSPGWLQTWWYDANAGKTPGAQRVQ